MIHSTFLRFGGCGCLSQHQHFHEGKRMRVYFHSLLVHHRQQWEVVDIKPWFAKDKKRKFPFNATEGTNRRTKQLSSKDMKALGFFYCLNE